MNEVQQETVEKTEEELAKEEREAYQHAAAMAQDSKGQSYRYNDVEVQENIIRAQSFMMPRAQVDRAVHSMQKQVLKFYGMLNRYDGRGNRIPT